MKFEKLHELKKGKHAITGLCMALGVTLLTSAVYASYDDANGYQNYKEAVKRLAFKEKNVTAQISAKIYADGNELFATEGRVAVDGNNFSEQQTKWDQLSNTSTTDRDYMAVQKNGKTYHIYGDDKTYEEYDGVWEERNGLLNMPDLDSDPSAQKAIRFVELAGDAFIGDIKNNVVLESKKDGIKNYTVSASQVQIPEVINAGVAMLGTFGIRGGGYVDYVATRYVDYDAARRAYYKQQTGKDLPENYYESKDANEIDKVLEGFYGLTDKYQKDGKGGVVVVYKDASTKYYASISQAIEDPANVGAFDESDYFTRFFGKDAWIKSGTNDFSIDENGRLVSSDATIVLATVDMDGKEHEIKIVLSARFTDYGTTEVKVPNLDEYKKIAENEEAIPYGEKAVPVTEKPEVIEKNSETESN